MKICPTCSAQYADDANFCPMDATRLQELAPPAAPLETVRDGAQAVAGRFLLAGGPALAQTPTGEEYEAIDGQSGRAVRLKLIDKSVLPTAMLIDRAMRELKQLAKVTSDRVVHVIDQGKTDDGRVFVVTEPLRGPSLEEIVGREGALTFERAKSIVLAVGEALSEAQKVGVVHRDVGAQNVLLLGERIALTGFGVAPPVSDRIFGTPAFLSPEQAEGKPVDQRSNIYSLGALFYFALTGCTPFEGSDVHSDPELLLRQHMHAQPIAPSQRRPGLTPEIDKVMLKALEKSGGRRHLTLRQLINEIDGLLPPASLSPVVATPIRAVPARKVEVETEREARPVPQLISAPLGEAAAAPSAKKKLTPLPATREAPVREAAAMEAVASSAPLSTAAAVSAKIVEATPPAEAKAMAEIHSAPTARVAPEADAPKMAAAAPAKEVPAKSASVAAKEAPASAKEHAPTTTATGGKKKKGFRETAWFKKGELEEQVAQKAAQGNPDDPLAGPAVTEVVVDDASLTDEDRARLSLRSGGTEQMLAMKRQTAFGDRMSEAEMLAEVDQSKRWIVIGAGIAGVILIVAAILFFVFRG